LADDYDDKRPGTGPTCGVVGVIYSFLSSLLVVV
jgi:hypothetical protein